MVVRWGFAGASNIGSDFKIGLDVHPDKHQVVAVAARSLEKAQEYATNHKIQRAYGSYEELAGDAEVEIVYVGVITSHHFQLSKFFLERGKSVLCELPLSLRADQVRELVALAKEKGLFFCENLWMMNMPAIQKARAMISNGELGEVTFVGGHFMLDIAPLVDMNAKEPPRHYSAKTGGGSWSAFGNPFAMVSEIAFGGDAPLNIKAFGNVHPETGFDSLTTAIFDYGKGRLAQYTASIATDGFVPSITIAGTKGWIRFDFPVNSPEALTSHAGQFKFPHPKSTSDKTPTYPNASAFSYIAEEIRGCLEGGLKESPLVSHALSVRTAESINGVLKEAGYHYSSYQQK